MIDSKIRKTIETVLQNIEKSNNVKILYACESGSRGWGFPSPDSDYDVRFIYTHPRDHYLSIDNIKDTMVFPIDDELDIGGWDIKKVLQHIRKSNPVMGEWLQSPIVYMAEEKIQENLFNLVKEYFSQRAALHHYLGILKKYHEDLAGSDEIKIKRLFYVLRPLLSALWIRKYGEVPPMEFHALLKLIQYNSNKDKISEILKLKSQSDESYILSVDASLKKYIEKQYTKAAADAESFELKDVDSEKLNEFFVSLLNSVG